MANARSRKQGIGFGGTLGEPRLWIDSLLQNGHLSCLNCKSFLRPDDPEDLTKKTFGIAQVRGCARCRQGLVNALLSGACSVNHACARMQLEVWGLGGKKAAEYQQKLRQWEDKQVQRVGTYTMC